MKLVIFRLTGVGTDPALWVFSANFLKNEKDLDQIEQRI